jgi:hypothetical protein
VRIGIDYPDYRTIGRSFVAFEWERCFLSPAPKYKFADTGTYSVESDHRLSFFVQVCVERLNEQDLSTFKRFILDSRDYRANDASYLH